MSDFGDRGRRRKKRGIKTKECISPVNMPRPIILIKPSVERQTPTSSSTDSKFGTKPQSETVPTVLLRSKDESGTPTHSFSSAVTTATTTILVNRDTTASSSSSTTTSSTVPPTVTITSQQQPVYQIQQKNAPVSTTPATTPTAEGGMSFESRLAPPVTMKTPVKLIDESLQWCDNAVEFLQDQSDYLIIGVIGFQGVGKSTLMSYIGGNKPEDSPKSYIFKAQSRELRELGEHCTNGIDIYITSERIILLDVQPILSASVMDHMMEYEKKYSTEYPSVESALEIQSLQLVSFLMAVCHTILLVQDWFCDVSLLRFVHTAEMLKPSTPATIHDSSLGMEDQVEYYPHLVFVHTRCNRENFTSSREKTIKDIYSSVFKNSKLKFKTSITTNLKSGSPSDTPINIFFIADKYSTIDSDSSTIARYQGHPGYATLVNNFCHQVTLLPRSPLTRTAQSEKNWFHYAARTWELVKKSNLFMEYSRLLP